MSGAKTRPIYQAVLGLLLECRGMHAAAGGMNQFDNNALVGWIRYVVSVSNDQVIIRIGNDIGDQVLGWCPGLGLYVGSCCDCFKAWNFFHCSCHGFSLSRLRG